MSIVFVAVVQTVVVSIANVNPWNAISIVASEQITEARSALRFAVLWWLIGSVATIIIAVAIPRGRNASMIRASEAVLWTRTRSTMQHILVGIITTIVISITQPIRFHANIGLFALQMIFRASRILRTLLVRLVGRTVVLAIVHTIANLCLRNTAPILTGEFTMITRIICASHLIRTVLAVVVVITHPRLEYATSVLAAILVRRTRMERTIVGVLIRVIATIIFTITRPHSRNALSVHAVEFTMIAGVVLRRTHSTFVHYLRVIVAATFCQTIQTRMTALRASTVVLQTRIGSALLTRLTVDVNAAW